MGEGGGTVWDDTANLDAAGSAHLGRRSVSMVVPFYNPGDELQKLVDGLLRVLAGSGWSYEVIAVSDGSNDGSAAALMGRTPRYLKVIELPINRGKGFAVRTGMLIAEGDYIGFIDADGDYSPDNLAILMRLAAGTTPDAVIGSKCHPGSQIEMTFARRLLSRLWQELVALLFSFPFKDSQSGIKLFRRDMIAACVTHTRIDGFAFDLELLAVAHELGYRDVVEAPIVLSGRTGSTVSVRPALAMLRDMLSIKWRMHVRRELRPSRPALSTAALGPPLDPADEQGT